ncbi:MAG TPA: Maf family protein [Alcanivoracaceae bacterium]|nr:Maf family protein [Alcanivoracaceae bacterium]
MQLFLASGSPRRRELLTQIGVPFTLMSAPDIDETPLPGEHGADYVQRLALEKAQAGWRALTTQDEACVLGADTVVMYQDQLLGKPTDAQHAKEILSFLSGTAHQVLTGVALCGEAGCEAFVSVTDVTMRPLSAEDIARYIATGEPFDKAGAYGIQGYGAALISGITGCYSTVVGLPLAETAHMLERAGVPIWQNNP